MTGTDAQGQSVASLAPAPPEFAHLVAPDDCCDQPQCDGNGSVCGGEGVDGAAKAIKARVTGTPIWTLCGIALLPSKDPGGRVTCPACLAVFRDLTGAEDDRDCREG